ncbi:MAG: phosphate uptake regulator PhoU [Thermoprotei archaeon]|nr:MAG: phosphate uptake regulator PhoU [Thermoprotei archaeon]
MKLAPEVRKVQLTGGATLIVSLPKDWVRVVNLKPGEEVLIIPQPDLSLLLVPKKGMKIFPSEIVLDVTKEQSIERITRMILAHFVAGYDIIKVRFSPNTISLRKAVKEIVRRKMVGAEIISESSDELTIQCLVSYKEVPISKLVERMAIIADAMYFDALKSLIENKKDLARDVIERDDEVDRFYWLAVRQLKKAVLGKEALTEIGLKDPRQCLGYRIVAKSIERIADHASKIASAALKIGEKIPSELAKSILEYAEYARSIFNDAVKAFQKVSGDLAQSVMDRVLQIPSKEEELLIKIVGLNLSPITVAELRIVLDSIRRVAEYSADISEITIHLGVEEKQVASLPLQQ